MTKKKTLIPKGRRARQRWAVRLLAEVGTLADLLEILATGLWDEAVTVGAGETFRHNTRQLALLAKKLTPS